MSSSDSSFSVDDVSRLITARLNDTGEMSSAVWGARTLLLSLLLGLLGGGTASSGSSASGGGGTATGADVGQEVLDILAVKSL